MDASLSIAMLPMPSWISLLLVTLGGVCSFAYLLRSILRGKEKRPASAKSKARLPPGPNGLPIIGNLHMLGSLPHRDLHRLAMKYGPIMYMQLGQVPLVIASSPQAAQLFLKTHDLVFSSRPITEVGKYTSYDGRGLADAPYGPYWRNIRKLCTLRLLSNLMIDSFKPMRREELGLLVQSLKDSAQAHAMVDLTMKVSSLSTSMTCRTVLGKKYTDESFDKKGFKGVIDDLSAIVGAFNVADYIPYIGALDLQGLRRRAVAICKIFDDFFEKIIDEHVADRGERRERDFIDSMLSFMNSEENEFQFDRTNIKALILDLLVAAMDSSAAVMEWTLAELLKHPHVMKKAQEELETAVGLDRMVEESDLANLEYLDMVIKESLRLHPVLPLLIPHKSTEDCTVDGYHIPKGSQLIINTWTIGRDPNVWTDPEEFNPERFKDTGIDVRGHDFQLLPFGSGRRGCPGMQLGLTVVRFVLAQLVHCFNWELPTGMQPADLDMTEKFGLVVPKANHVLAIPTYRLRHAS